MRAAGLVAALALTAAPVAAADEPPQQGRVWTGTLGEQAITACFVDQPIRDGLYYATATLEPLRLVEIAEVDPPVFTEIAGREDQTGAVWAMHSLAEDHLTGEWRKGDAALPIRLTATLVALPEYGSACETAAFLDPLLAGGAITAERAQLGGAAYARLTYQGPRRAGLEDYQVTSLALDLARPGDPAINHALAAALPDGTAAHFMGQCVGLSLPGGISGYLEEALAPIILTPRWLGLRRSGTSFCGGLHPSHFNTMAVHDRDSGAEVDPSGWFKPGALGFYEWEVDLEPKPIKRPIAGLSEALARAVLAQWPAADDRAGCVAAARDNTGWEIGLTRAGPVFVPQFPHVIFACTEEIVLPWAKARPFLSDQGRAVETSLR
jgi:hypothetical protein